MNIGIAARVEAVRWIAGWITGPHWYIQGGRIERKVQSI
jgi:hypothetical protein